MSLKGEVHSIFIGQNSVFLFVEKSFFGLEKQLVDFFESFPEVFEN
jgi:hypothetical protein